MRHLCPVEVNGRQRAIRAAHEDIIRVHTTADDLGIPTPQRVSIGKLPFQLTLKCRKVERMGQPPPGQPPVQAFNRGCHELRALRERLVLAELCRRAAGASLSNGRLRNADLRAAVRIALLVDGAAPQEWSPRARSPEAIPSSSQLHLEGLARLLEPSRDGTLGRDTARTQQLDVLAPTLQAPTGTGQPEQGNRKASRRQLPSQTELSYPVARKLADLCAMPLSVSVFCSPYASRMKVRGVSQRPVVAARGLWLSAEV